MLLETPYRSGRQELWGKLLPMLWWSGSGRLWEGPVVSFELARRLQRLGPCRDADHPRGAPHLRRKPFFPDWVAGAEGLLQAVRKWCVRPPLALSPVQEPAELPGLIVHPLTQATLLCSCVCQRDAGPGAGGAVQGESRGRWPHSFSGCWRPPQTCLQQALPRGVAGDAAAHRLQ